MNELLIVAIVIAIYWRTTNFEPIDTWEDPWYPMDKFPDLGVPWGDKKGKGGTYQPLRDISFWLDQRIWRNPAWWSYGYHIQNMIWYAGTCIIVYWLVQFLLEKGL